MERRPDHMDSACSMHSNFRPHTGEIRAFYAKLDPRGHVPENVGPIALRDETPGAST